MVTGDRAHHLRYLLFSIVTLVAHQQLLQHPFELPKAAWYRKTLPTFADALALVRQQLWQMQTFQMSSADVDTVKVPRALQSTLGLTCFAMLLMDKVELR